MTTRVTIKNEETSGHSIKVVVDQDMVGDVLKPSEVLTRNVWGNMKIEITEIPLPEVSFGANPPDPSYIGMTAEEYLKRNDKG